MLRGRFALLAPLSVCLALSACSNDVNLCLSGGCEGGSSSGGGSSSSSSSGGGAQATLTGFVNPNPVQLGATTTLGVQLSNSSSAQATGISTAVDFPSSLTVNSGPSTNCPSGTTQFGTPTQQTSEVDLNNASVNGNSSCTVSVVVTPPATGQYVVTAAGKNITLTVN